VIDYPSACFLTFSTYGIRLHGDERGSVNRKQNGWEEPMLSHNATLSHAEAPAMRGPIYLLYQRRRKAVADAIRQTCAIRGWRLIALHVRSNHVHLVVHGASTPERMLNDFKSYASRRIAIQLRELTKQKRWTRHGSTRCLWSAEAVEAAVKYIIEEQGKQMEFVADTEDVDL
jgi:REP element-mobilizing transposase RayT